MSRFFLLSMNLSVSTYIYTDTHILQNYSNNIVMLFICLCLYVYSLNKTCCSVLSHSVMSNTLQPHQAPLFMGILQARIVEWVAMSSSRGSSQPVIKPRAPLLYVDSLPSEPPGKPQNTGVGSLSLLQGIMHPLQYSCLRTP